MSGPVEALLLRAELRLRLVVFRLLVRFLGLLLLVRLRVMSFMLAQMNKVLIQK